VLARSGGRSTALSRQAQSCEAEMKKWWDDKTIWRIWRGIVLFGGTFLLIDLGLDRRSEPLPSLLTIIGAVAVGVFFSKVWQEPKP
jgi:hypothetical protein